ncbi:hypothetical protein CY34DRAFT_301958 [Suillus luteus UH-Slu-Lm8-n1]|uniref:Uncharacterized protein n=1 Tax=Suillus luteus UH-Slu-Lm8-n1 TaxID=930992 RepID=A0A0D0B7L2_9AGAM|nr:hypothetical protein CY34DRAFT_301958 [Suillus luteus UH-Slu-Lm8-n1]
MSIICRSQLFCALSPPSQFTNPTPTGTLACTTVPGSPSWTVLIHCRSIPTILRPRLRPHLFSPRYVTRSPLSFASCGRCRLALEA